MLFARSGELCAQGRFVEAESYALAALKAAEAFAPPDIRLAQTQHQLGSVYREIGRLQEAERWYRRALSSWKDVSGSGTGELPKPLISLASLYLESGMHGKAERLLQPWIENPMRLLDADPGSVRLLHSLAAIHHRQRRYRSADVLYRRALAAAEKAFESNSEEVALLLNNLGLLLADAKQHTEAGLHLERALAIWENVLGPDHPDVARALTNLAAFYSSTEERAKAAPLFQRALSIAENTFGPENRLVGKILAEYASLLRRLKRPDEAKLLEQRAHKIRGAHVVEDLGRHTIDVRDLVTSNKSSAR